MKLSQKGFHEEFSLLEALFTFFIKLGCSPVCLVPSGRILPAETLSQQEADELGYKWQGK
jgi:hypothetical protein